MNLLDLRIEGESAKMLDAVRDGVSVSAFGLPQNARVYLSARLNKRLVYVAADYLSAKRAYTLLKQLKPDTVFFPAKEETLIYARTGAETRAGRINAMGSLIEGKAEIIVMPAEALIQRVPKRRLFEKNIFTLKTGNFYVTDGISQELIKSGYTRADMIEKEGEYSLRGDILDIYPSVGNAIRCEFFGDQLESIKELNVATRLSGKKKDEVSLYPATEILASQDTLLAALEAMRKDAGKYKDGKPARLADDLEADILRGRTDSLEMLVPYIEEQSSCITEYLGGDTVIIYDEAKDVADNLGYVHKEHANRLKTLLEEGAALPKHINALIPAEEIFSKTSAFTQLAYHELLTQNRLFTPRELFNFNSPKVPKYSHSFDTFVADLRAWIRQGCRIAVCVRDEAAIERIGNMLYDNDLIYGQTLAENPGVYLLPVTFDNGLILNEEKLVIIGTYDIMPRTMEKRAHKTGEVFTVSNVGDFVVHQKHGIGQIESVEHMDGVFGAKDYIIVRYSGGDRLYVPTIEAHRLSRYAGAEGEVKLNKIGGIDFAKVKEKAKKGIKQMAFDLVELYAGRAGENGFVYDYDQKLLGEFAAGFPHAETDDQLRAAAEILGDMRKGKVMDRLLCGDVGYGKTEVALRAAVAAVSCGKQVAFLAPTTILTEQHYKTAASRMGAIGIETGVLSRFHSEAENRAVLKKLAEGKIDVVFGTHRLLSKDVIFRDLGMLILDEEQRFGVEHKEKIKNLKISINVLTLTATPIPRTLHMSLSGIRDMSSLDTPPAERLPVRTFVTEYTESVIIDAVNREIMRGGQVFIVYNRVASIDSFRAKLAQLMPNVRFLTGHGQMDADALDSVISDFYAGKADVLIASAIIENGIDIPNANTIIVIDSDCFGLSQMYQLRGRVGRSNRLAYAYFTFDGNKLLTSDAAKRLSAISEFTEFGSGYKLSMRDLEIRGAGNILGREQHGHMQRVGYDMYLRLLEEAVGELQGRQAEVSRETRVDMKMDAVIPESYIESPQERMYMYQKIAAVRCENDRSAVISELEDVYGKVPKAIINLTYGALIRYYGERINAARIEVGADEAKICFDNLEDIGVNVQKTLENAEGCILKMQKSPVIAFDSRYKKNVTANLLDFLTAAVSGNA